MVDECQNFLNLPRSFDEMLAEARGYRLSMVLAHQHLGQLPKELRETVSSNARTKVWFSMSPEDAHVLGRHVAPEVSEHDLAHLGAYTAAARLVVDSEETPAFTLRTRPAPPAVAGRAQAVRDANRAAHHRQPDTKTARPVLAGRALPAPPPRGDPCRRQCPAMSVVGSVKASTEGSAMGSVQEWSPRDQTNLPVRAAWRAPSRRATQGVGGRESVESIRPRAGPLCWFASLRCG